MRLSLAESLAHIGEQARPHLSFDTAALAGMVEGMKAGARYPASTFALYAQVVVALCDGDNRRAESLLHELALERPLTARWRVLALDHPVHRPHAGRYRELLDTDPDTRFHIGAPPADLAASFQDRVLGSFGLLASAIPQLAAEFSALVSDIVAVVGDPQASYQFDGGSSYMLWGGLFLNAASHHDQVAMIEVMAHESAHLLLYACAAEEALVENDDSETYASPLRVDRRPMDGIYHATFVSARMHWAMSRLLESGLLDDAARAAADLARQSDRDNFQAGWNVVSRHGRLTETGARVMHAAHAYMAS